MSDSSVNSGEVKLLPGVEALPPDMPPIVREPTAAVISGSNPPPRQLSELPRDELNHLGEEFGLDPTTFKNRQQLVVAIHERRQMIASMDRDSMLDVIRWGRRPVTANASKEQIAQEIARVRSMRFAGLSQRGLIVLARMRGLDAREEEPVPLLIRKLRRKEGFLPRINRKRRALLGGLVAKVIGETESAADYQFLPTETASPDAVPPRTNTIKEDIEESGLIGGITNRLKKSADGYLNQKLDEIEARIDRKLDEIDRRLAEWRDKEIANRIRILKITLWASVIVGAFSLVYSYVTVVLFPRPLPPGSQPVQQHVLPHAPKPQSQR
jgi:hypothetical protein